ncbi:hypothetical protein A5M85_03785 [Cellulophaga lytica]|uniref:type VI secretion system Vgr family protein n=1 Tax=Cellulophaga lytica TaxID=979 RepID=UPI000950B2F7|nr:phage baseplate assembly protein V [Cellulophaga lytica]APU09432.1 hypothetical protein A5M85_03785 [Cellulophaga lytica]
MTPENKQISINGKFISGFKHITLNQKINNHHSFEVGIDLEAAETTTAHTINKSKEWLGKTILITTTGKDFTGIITNISLNQNNGNHGQILVTGYSPTILLDDSELMQSWLNKPLADIISDTTNNPRLNVAIAPEHTANIEYQAQYLETNFKFVQRIAKQYNEWLFYNGDTLFFGKPSPQDAVTIEYGKDLTQMNIGIQTNARKISAFSFNATDVQQFNSNSPDNPAGLNELGQHAFNVSLDTFSNPTNAFTSARVKNKADIDDYVMKKQQSAAADSSYITGKSTKRGLTVGSIIDVETAVLNGAASYATKKHGKYIITEITHHAKEANYYTNTFVALPADIKSLPEPKVALPVAQTQMATVLSNQDPKKKGRVQVKMNWQTGEMKTAWIRVMTPDAGKSDEHGEIRGNLVIPEIGDQVVLGFRYNDPNRPFVLGSMYNGGSISDGKENRNSLVSRMGSKMIMDDNDGSLQLTDKGGVDMKFDGAGNATTDVATKQTINVGGEKDSPNSTFNMDSDGNIIFEGKKSLKITIGESVFEMSADGTIKVNGKKITLKAESETEILAANNHIEGITKLDGGDVFIN